MNMFNTKTDPYKDGNPYDDYDYINFHDLGNAMLVLFQINIQAGWLTNIFAYAYMFDDFA